MLAAAVLALALQAARAGAVTPTDPAHQAVLAPVNAVFAALATRDADGLDVHFDPAAQLTVVHETAGAPGRVTHLTWQQFAGGLQPGPEKLEEALIEPTIAIDGDIAMVWSEYVFRVDGHVSHCGVDHFGLVRTEGAWKITSLTWNQRTNGCETLDARTR